MALKGMDTDAVRQLSAQMNHAQEQIRQLTQQLSHSLNSVQWVGPDREQFVNDWQSTHVSSLHNVAQAIEMAAQRATQNASEQDNVSA